MSEREEKREHVHKSVALGELLNYAQKEESFRAARAEEFLYEKRKLRK